MKEENINNRELKTTETKSNSELSCQVIQPNSFINGDCMDWEIGAEETIANGMLKFHDQVSSQFEPPVKPATCGRCEDCKFWFVSPEQEEMAEASGEDIELHERCNNEDSFVYSLPTYNYFGCIHFSKLSV